MSATLTTVPSPLFVSGDPNGMGGKFQSNFDRSPFCFEHRLSDDPLFELSSIRALAERLPGKNYFNGNLAIDQGWKDSAPKKSTFQQSLDQLQDGRSWIILKRVHEDPEYRDLMRQCLQEVEALAKRPIHRLIESRTMSLILSSPGQVTPYHIDADCNFLFHIRGCKMFYVFNGNDRSVLTPEEEEAFWAGNHNAARFREENQGKAWTFALKPGIGVHVPVMFPHWVKNSDEISISLSVNFRFRGGIRANTHRMNHLLRKAGLHPRPVGESPMADSVKSFLIGVPRAGVRKLRAMRRQPS